jgi:hypothetical protein
LTQADVLRQKKDAEISRTNAQFTMEYAISRARIERDKKLALSQIFRGEAICDRMVANANASKTCKNADLDAKYATAQADMDIILASNSAKRDATKTYLEAIKARFNARVQQVEAERVIDIAGEHNVMTRKRTGLAEALAQAEAAREDSNQKLVELQKKQAELQTASMVNWSDKLAKFRDAKIDISLQK